MAISAAASYATMVLLSLAAALGFAAPTQAQGALNLTNETALSWNTTGGTGGAFYEIQNTGTNPLRIYRVGFRPNAAGTHLMDVYYRVGGCFTSYPPTTATTQFSGWTYAGSATVTFPTNAVTQIPVNINASLPVNAYMGILMASTTATAQYTSSSATPNFSNADLTIRSQGGKATGTMTAPGTPPGTPFTSGNIPRVIPTTIWYDYDQFPGTHMSVDGVQVNTNTGLQIGANTVQAVIKNMGTTVLDNVPVVAEYSTDGGTTWSPSQTFTFPSFPTLSSQTATFTLPWNVTAFAVRELQVRLVAPTTWGQGTPLKTRTFTPDFDLEAVTVTPAAALNTPLTVGFTARNDGDWSFNTQGFTARYTLDGISYTNQAFTPTTLGANNTTQTFSFTTPMSIVVQGNYSLSVSLLTQYASDPDTGGDSASLALDNVGIPFSLYAPTAGTSTTLTVPIYRSASTATNGSTHVVQMIYTAAQLPGLPTGAVMTDLEFFKSNDHRMSPGKSAILRVWLQNTTLTVFPTSPLATYADFHVGSTLVFESNSWSFRPDIGWTKFGPFNQPTPFVYNGGNLVVSLEWNTAGQSPPVTEPGPSAATALAWQCETSANVAGSGRSYYLLTTQPAPTATLSLTGTGGPSLRRPQARFLYSPPTNTDLDMASVTFGTSAPFATGPSIGSNTVNATVRSLGTLPYSGNFNLEYSTNAGTTWVTNPPFTASGLSQIGATQTVTFATPWVISAPLAPQSIMVRFAPSVAGDPDTLDQITIPFTPDADVTAVTLNMTPAQLNTPMTVQATVRNAGSLGLNSVAMPLRYRLTQGTTVGSWVSQTFVATSLSSVNDTQTFSFTQTVTFPTQGNYTIEVEFETQVPGDPDTSDANIAYFSDIGAIIVNYNGPTGGSATTSAYPFNYTSAITLQLFWEAADLNSTNGFLNSMGLLFTAAHNKTYANIKITVGECSTPVLSRSTTYAQNFNAGAAPVVVFDGPYTITTTTANEIYRIPFTTPYLYSGQNALAILYEISSAGVGSGSSQQLYSLTGTGPRIYTLGSIGTVGTIQASLTSQASFAFTPPYNPGLAVRRGTTPVGQGSTDNVGVTLTAGSAQTLTYELVNAGTSTNLTVTSVTVSNQTNCTAAVSGTAPTSVPFGGAPVNLPLTVNPSPGAYSFDVTIVSNTAQPGASPYTFTVSGTGFVNTAPQIVLPIVGTGLQATGTHPNYEVSIVSGTAIDMTVRATDVDTFHTLSLAMDVATTGSTITPAQAGFTTTFPATATAGTSPRNIVLAGTAGTPGIVVFTATVQDNGLNPLSDTVTITFKVGARIDVTTAATVSQFVRVSGQKDFYRGQTGMAVDIMVSNNNPFAIRLDSLALQVAPTAGGGPVSGITFSLLTSPVLLQPMTTNVVIPCTMDIAANAGGTNNMPCQFTISTGAAVNPAAPTDPVVIFVTAPVDNIVLFDGPVPQPMQITLNAFNPAVETVPYLQSLTVSGGLGSYTWSIPPTSANQLPTGLILDPQGSQFLPAKISGTAALGTAILGPYTITLQVSDTAYLATKTLTLNVSALTPLTFPPVTLASGQEYVAYSMTTPFTATGGSLIYTFGVDPSSVDQLPTGLTLNPQTGVISGTPADGTQRSYSITFMLDDGQSQLTQTQTLVINPHPLQWRGTTLPTAVQTVSYSEALDAIGGTGPRIYSIVSGTLPNGLSLNASNGVILGIPSLTPNSVGTYNMVFKVTDGLNASVNQAITITVVPAPPLVVTTSVLEYGMVGATYASAIAVTGGSQSYVISVASSSAAQLPAGLTLAPNGDITGTPEVGSDGRYAIDISVNDGFQTITETVILPVLNDGARGVAITEVSAGAGYIELANSEQTPVDVSGWSVTIWVDSTSPISLPFDSIPGASLALPAEVVTITLGGTAGGFWPSYNTGGTWTGTSTSNISVLLSDIHGNTIDFVSFGTANRTSLVDSANAAIDLPAPLDTMANANSGAANYSYNGMAWVGSATGTPGVYNTGLAAFPLMIIKDALRTANSGQPFSDFTLAIGGRAPYSFTLTAPAAPWLSLSTNGVFSGTAPLVATATTVNVDVTVTDALTAAVTETFEIRIAPASTTPSATFTVGNAEGQSFEGTVIDVPVTMTRASGVTDVQGFSFVIELAAPTALELDVVRVLPGPAVIAAGRTVVARDIGNNRIFVGDYSDATAPAANFADGVVAIVRFMVPVDNNVMAPEATYGVSIADTEIGRAATGVHTATGVNGSMILSNYKPQDVNRDTAIDVVDVQQTVNIILSLFTPTYAGQGDANSDNAVDVVDVQTIVNCILLGGC